MQKGVKGYKVTGPNGNSIFLPAAGCMCESTLSRDGSYGYYWSSSLYTDDPDDPDNAYYVDFRSGRMYRYRSYRDNGLSVRPVCK